MSLFLRNSLRLFTVTIFVWGVAVILCRVVFSAESRALFHGLVFLPVLMLIAAVLARRHVPSSAAVSALLDSTNDLGGLFMAFGAGAGGDEWLSQMPSASLPRVRWHSPAQWFRALAGCVFAFVCLLAPVSSTAAKKASRMAIGDILSGLQAKIEVLEDEEVISDDDVRQLTETLQTVYEQATGEDPAKTWEALDHVASRIADEADREAEDALRRASLFQRLGTVSGAAAILAMESDFGADALTEVMQEMKSLAEAEGLEHAIPEELVEALLSKELGAQDMNDLAEAMKLSREELEKMLERLEDAELVDADILEKCRACKSGDGCEGGDKALAAFLAEQGENAAVAMLCGMCRTPGKGGISRGRGDAEMTWTSGTSEENASFNAEAIPSDILRDPGRSRVIGISASAPEENDGSVGVTSGVLSEADVGGGSARKQLLLPKHRQAVGTFFSRKERDSK